MKAIIDNIQNDVPGSYLVDTFYTKKLDSPDHNAHRTMPNMFNYRIEHRYQKGKYVTKYLYDIKTQARVIDINSLSDVIAIISRGYILKKDRYNDNFDIEFVFLIDYGDYAID